MERFLYVFYPYAQCEKSHRYVFRKEPVKNRRNLLITWTLALYIKPDQVLRNKSKLDINPCIVKSTPFQTRNLFWTGMAQPVKQPTTPADVAKAIGL